MTVFKTIQNRKEKINFLRGIICGENKIKDLLPLQIKIKITLGEGANVYTEAKTGRILTQPEISEYHDFIRLRKDIKFRVRIK